MTTANILCILCDAEHPPLLHQCSACGTDVAEDRVVFDGMGFVCCRDCGHLRGVFDDVEDDDGAR